MITLRNFSFTHDRQESPTLKHLNLTFEPGEFALICGPTGSGKSTLLQTLNGLAPHFTAGKIAGELFIGGENLTNQMPHEFSERVGYVNQQAENSFVADRVDEEIAFGMEQLGVPEAEIEARILEIAAVLGLQELLHSNLAELSGGQQQRVAIAAALAAGQKILLLDEPTSELDAASAHELLEILRSLTRTQNLTVLIAEHRIERAIDLVDSITVVHPDGSATKAKTPNIEPLLQNYRMVPPVIELGQALNLKPLPLTVNEAKKLHLKFELPVEKKVDSKSLISVANLSVSYGSKLVVQNATFDLKENCITGLMGPNGSGKSTLLWAIQERFGCTLLPQTASDLLMFNSVAEELADSDRESNAAPGLTARMLEQISQRLDPNRHPRDLSAGQQLSLVLAIQLTRATDALLLDEPTRGLDYEAKRYLAKQLQELKRSKAILLASHDVEFLALVADEIIEINGGVLENAKTPRESLGNLGDLAPQIWQVTKSAMTVSAALATVKR